MKPNTFLLGELIDIKHGYAFPGGSFSDDLNYPTLVTPGNFSIGGGFQEVKPKTFTGDIPAEYVFESGDLVVTMTDLSKAGDSLGYSAQIPTGRTYLHNQRIGKVIVKRTELLSENYLNWFMRTDRYRRAVIGSATGTTVRHTSPSRILEIPISLPSLDVQFVVAETLDGLAKKIQTDIALSKTLEDFAQTIFKSWFIDFDPVTAKMAGKKPAGMDAGTAALFPDSMEESELGLVPKGWKVRTIGDSVIKQRVGKLFDSKTSSAVGAVPVLDQGKSGVVGFHDEEPGVIASPDEPLVVFANHTCLLRLISYPFSVIQNVFPLIGNVVDTIWLYFAVEGKQQFDSYKGHWPDFVLHKVIHPPLEVTVKYREVVEPLLKEKWLLEEQSKVLGNLRDSLLPRLISGELQIPEEMLVP